MELPEAKSYLFPMCGRHTHHHTWREIVELYRLTDWPPPSNLQPRYNIAPTQQTPIIRLVDGKRHFGPARWWFTPPWVKDLKAFKATTFNARAEDLRASKLFAPAFDKGKRCLVDSSGWHEWRKVDAKTKVPTHLRRPGRPTTYAGLWSETKLADGEKVVSCTIITTAPTDALRHIHDRMPCVLDEADFEAWLEGPLEEAEGLMRTFTGEIEVFEIGPEVGNVKNDHPGLIEPVQGGSPLASVPISF